MNNIVLVKDKDREDRTLATAQLVSISPLKIRRVVRVSGVPKISREREVRVVGLTVCTSGPYESFLSE